MEIFCIYSKEVQYSTSPSKVIEGSAFFGFNTGIAKKKMGKLLLVAKSCDYLGRNVFCG
jgi:hypothetical protein